MSDLRVTYAKEFIVTLGHTSTMVLCTCGDIFQDSGPQAEVDERFHAWDAQHARCTEPKRDERKVFWLSFCDSQKPTGQQFLGACLVEVTAAQADEMARDAMSLFPMMQPGAEWIGAATRHAHHLGCNPGGEMASVEIDPEHPNLKHYRFGVLMDRATIESLDASAESM